MDELLQFQQGRQVNCPALFELLRLLYWIDIGCHQLGFAFLLAAASKQPSCTVIYPF